MSTILQVGTMVVAVTGGTGFVGAGVVRAHLSRGDDVRVLTRREAPPALAGARLVRGNLAHGEVPKEFLSGADVLYHCAGELRNEGGMYALHVEGTRRLLELASGAVGRWVQLSSVGVYGPRREGTITEDTTFDASDFRDFYFKGKERKRQVVSHVNALRADLGEGVSLPDTALRFCLTHPAVSSVIPGMRSRRHVDSNVALSDLGPLDTETLRMLKGHAWDRNFYTPV